MIIYLHEDIESCPFIALKDFIEIDCWNWPEPLTGVHVCMGGKNQCSQVV